MHISERPLVEEEG